MMNLLRSASRAPMVLTVLVHLNAFRLLRAGPTRPASARDDFFMSTRALRQLVTPESPQATATEQAED